MFRFLSTPNFDNTSLISKQNLPPSPPQVIESPASHFVVLQSLCSVRYMKPLTPLISPTPRSNASRVPTRPNQNMSLARRKQGNTNTKSILQEVLCRNELRMREFLARERVDQERKEQEERSRKQQAERAQKQRQKAALRRRQRADRERRRLKRSQKANRPILHEKSHFGKFENAMEQQHLDKLDQEATHKKGILVHEKKPKGIIKKRVRFLLPLEELQQTTTDKDRGFEKLDHISNEKEEEANQASFEEMDWVKTPVDHNAKAEQQEQVAVALSTSSLPPPSPHVAASEKFGDFLSGGGFRPSLHRAAAPAGINIVNDKRMSDHEEVQRQIKERGKAAYQRHLANDELRMNWKSQTIQPDDGTEQQGERLAAQDEIESVDIIMTDAR